MKKSTIYVVMATLCLFFKVEAQVKTITIKGRITNEKGSPISNVTIKVKDSKAETMANGEGLFELNNVQLGATLKISSIGYKTAEIHKIQTDEFLIVRLLSEDTELEEVQVVSTGYQNIPKERATGSFTQIDSKTINRSVGINILDRLEGVTSGLLLNRGLNTGNNSKISVHGRSTLFANAEPLIVLNGFRFDGTIDQINPADIESITVLKDAAASSIWGTKSGNGVLVITTKSGKKHQRQTIGISSTLTISEKPNLYYTPQMSSSDFIDLEQFLYGKGLFDFQFFNPYNPVTSAVEVFNQRKNNIISSSDLASRINDLKSYDIRKDLNKYVYRSKIQQQYHLNLSGGNENHTYYLSGGYDKNLENKVSDNYNRISLNANNSFSLLQDKLNVSTDINFISSDTHSGNTYNPTSPYDRIADENGNSLAVITAAYRMSYVDTAGKGKLLDWHYRPKDELGAVNQSRINQYLIKVGLNYKILAGLDISATYQFLKEDRQYQSNNDVNSYYTRNLINQYSSITPNKVNRTIPIGNIFYEQGDNINSKLFRTQLNYKKTINSDHEVNWIAGYEGSDNRTNSNFITYYGYDPETLNHANATINPLAVYPLYYDPSILGQIYTTPQLSGRIDINQSFYTNASYTFKGRYILSGSARRDESNIFGVKTNQKGVPLWSVGLAWILNRENLYRIGWLPTLKVRATYGYNGNTDKTVSAYLTANSTSQLNLIGNLYSILQNPPNPSLRWEKIKTWNFGLDFASKENRISGSIDVYQKNAIDLIGNNPIAFQSGILQFKGNGASLRTNGVDFILNSWNLKRAVQWNTSLLFNYSLDKVTNYKIKQSSNSSIVNSNFQNPVEGYPYQAVFSFPSAGLDISGAPQGYLDGALSKDYTSITSKLDPNQLKYHGSAIPKYFGSLINTLAYKNFDLSINIIYKFAYFFRRVNVFSGSNYGYGNSPIPYQLADFEKRWQKVGDENITKIPALSYPSNLSSDLFFTNSEDLVERGDHIRVQDVRFSYSLLPKQLLNTFLRKASIFIYARNLGIIWRKNKLNIDPDYGSFNIPQPFSGSIGINVNL